jgi:hypothetical protein
MESVWGSLSGWLLRDPQDPHRIDLTEAGWMAVAMFLSCCFIVVLCRLYRGFEPSSYQTKGHEHHRDERVILWCTTVPCLLPAVLVPFYSIPAMFELVQRCGLHTTVCDPGDSLLRGYGLSCGYQVFDTLAMLLFSRQLKKLLTPSMFWTLLAHHILAVIFWTGAISGSKGALYTAYCLTTELTSLPLNVRWIAAETGKPGVDLLGICFFISFTVLRVLPIPFLLWYIANTDFHPHYNFFETVVAFAGLIPVGLNAFWYRGLLETAIAAAKGDPKKE